MESTETHSLPARRWLRAAWVLSIALFLLLISAQPAPAEEYYICAGGETVDQIADLTGVSQELLLAANDLTETADLATGQILRIPSDLLFTVTIQPGDTLYRLSEQYGVSVEEILEYNSVNPSRLRVGSVLSIPLGEEIAAISGASQAIPALSTLASRGQFMAYPVDGVISSRYGSRWGAFHYGLDLAADQGTVIQAAAAGLVTEADWKNDAYGYAVMLDHGNGVETLYGHCSQLLVKAGQQVRAGDAIALVGSTGNSTGPHVHFEVRVNGACQDPLDYL